MSSLRLRATSSLRRLGKRRRVVRQGVEIGDDVGAVGAANEAARIGDELIEILDGPVAALRLHGAGIVEAGLRCPLTADHAPQIRTDQVAPPLVEGMAGFSGAKMAPAAMLIASRHRQVPRTAPRILLTSKESIASTLAGSVMEGA